MITTAPQAIAPSKHTGTWTRRIRPGAHRVSTFLASELAAMDLPTQAAGELVIWESAGHMQGGAELFVRSRYVAQEDGSLVGYDADGRRIIRHPATRALTILTK